MKKMNDLKNSMMAFIRMILVVDLGSRWYLDEMADDILKDFVDCPQFRRRQVLLECSRTLLDLFGQAVKGQHRNRVFFRVKLKYVESNNVDIFILLFIILAST